MSHSVRGGPAPEGHTSLLKSVEKYGLGNYKMYSTIGRPSESPFIYLGLISVY